jgi:hypothetical protein
MRWLIGILLVVEVALGAAVWRGAITGNAAVLLLVANTVLLIFSARRWLRKPSCCR